MLMIKPNNQNNIYALFFYMYINIQMNIHIEFYYLHKYLFHKIHTLLLFVNVHIHLYTSIFKT